jgi:hypothetical protein
MKRVIIHSWILFTFFLPTSGCMTYLSVNIGNATKTKIVVKSSETGKEARISPGHFKKVPHGYGDLLINVPPNQEFKFRNVVPFYVDRKYLAVRNCFFGPNWVTLNVTLQTNLELYVLDPHKKIVENQPDGYPKAGENVDN